MPLMAVHCIQALTLTLYPRKIHEIEIRDCKLPVVGVLRVMHDFPCQPHPALKRMA